MYDINTRNTEKILAFCKENGIDVLGLIPFSPEVTQAMVNGKTIVEFSPKSIVVEEISNIWKKLSRFLNTPFDS
jgi:MinD superfamily P-loop ATPase